MLETITFVVTLLGLSILTFSFLELRMVRKKLDKVINKESFTEIDKLQIIKLYKLSMIGFSITSIMQLIRMFFK